MEPTQSQPTSSGCETAPDSRSTATRAPESIAPAPVDAASRLPPDERRRREAAVRFANASIGLEGFVVSAAEEVQAERFIAGEIDLPEFLSSPVTLSGVRVMVTDAAYPTSDGAPENGVSR